MARTPGFALVGVLLFAAACGAERGQDVEVVLGTATAAPSVIAATPAVEPTTMPAEPTDTPSATSTPEVEAEPSGAAAQLVTRFAAAAALVDDSSARTGVAVVTAEGVRYIGGDGTDFALASVVKLPIMLATLERARIEARPPSAQEEDLLRLMITASSNSATDVLWRSLGEADGVAALLEPLGIGDLAYAIDDQWGDSRATALEVASLLGLLVDEDSLLAPEVRAAALALLESVQADQRWGATAGIDVSRDAGVTVAIKNGWYPEPAGWLLNSAGIVAVGGMDEMSAVHIVVILTEGARSQTEGVRKIEEIAAAINHQIIPPALVVAPEPPTFTATPLPTVESDGSEVTDAEAAAAATPAPLPILNLTAYGAGDVLVPGDGLLIGTEGTASELRLWYRLSAPSAELLLSNYANSMLEFGWFEVSGPPSVVVAKSNEGRWVGLTSFPAAQGARLVEVTISPAPGVVPAGSTAP